MATHVMLAVLVALLAGCATYTPKPLPEAPDFARDLRELHVDPGRLSIPGLAAHRFDPAGALDMTDVAVLAVSNNPDLKLARDQAGIAQAQAVSAALLPDPQLSLSSDHPYGVAPSFTSAYSAGLTFDVASMVTHAAGRRAAKAEATGANLDVRWQEWQLVARAGLLFVQTVNLQQSIRLLQTEQALFRDRYERAKTALAGGNLTIAEASTYLSALHAVSIRIDDLQRQESQTRLDLNALLGLAPQVQLHLVGGGPLPTLDAATVQARLAEVAHRRPDLLALQAGYMAQEERLRQAVLAQFPALSVGFTRARDTTDVHTQGFGITLTLPIFNRNRGAIAVQTATRQRLRDEYQARLNAAYADVQRLLDHEQLLAAQQRTLDANLAQLRAVADKAEAAYREHAIDVLQYVTFRSAAIDAEVEAANLDALQQEQRIALDALIGGAVSAHD
jgi:outer membrane protein TolC